MVCCRKRLAGISHHGETSRAFYDNTTTREHGFMARRIKGIYVHTAAHADKDGRPVDTTAGQIDAWHRARGWRGIGYNAVVRFDGRIERGRDAALVPAGVEGDNKYTLHVCGSGHGDLADFTAAQKRSMAGLIGDWVRKNGLEKAFWEDPTAVVKGHREYWSMRGLPIKKTCPGKLVDMDEMRSMVRDALRGLTPTPVGPGELRLLVRGREVPAVLIGGRAYGQVRGLSEELDLPLAYESATNTARLG